MKAIYLILFIFLPFSSFSQDCNRADLLNASEFKQQISENEIQLLDVRTSNEFNSGHIEGAVSADVLNSQNFLSKISEFDKSQPIYIYCRSGNRSKKAAQLLCESGFKKVYDLKGGYLTWK